MCHTFCVIFIIFEFMKEPGQPVCYYPAIMAPVGFVTGRKKPGNYFRILKTGIMLLCLPCGGLVKQG